MTRLPFSNLIALSALADLKVGEALPSAEFNVRFNEIAEENGFQRVDPDDMWQFVNALLTRGLVERIGPRARGKRYKLAATAKGMNLLEAARRVLE